MMLGSMQSAPWEKEQKATKDNPCQALRFMTNEYAPHNCEYLDFLAPLSAFILALLFALLRKCAFGTPFFLLRLSQTKPIS